jgi:hypothetical protein
LIDLDVVLAASKSVLNDTLHLQKVAFTHTCLHLSTSQAEADIRTAEAQDNRHLAGACPGGPFRPHGGGLRAGFLIILRFFGQRTWSPPTKPTRGMARGAGLTTHSMRGELANGSAA